MHGQVGQRGSSAEDLLAIPHPHVVHIGARPAASRPAPRGWLQCAAAPSSLSGIRAKRVGISPHRYEQVGSPNLGRLEMLENVCR